MYAPGYPDFPLSAEVIDQIPAKLEGDLPETLEDFLHATGIV